jgi:hypothetical protein
VLDAEILVPVRFHIHYRIHNIVCVSRRKFLPPKAGGDRLMTTRELADFLRVSPATLKWWRLKRHRRGPRFLRLSRGTVRYHPADVKVWLEE